MLQTMIMPQTMQEYWPMGAALVSMGAPVNNAAPSRIQWKQYWAPCAASVAERITER